MNSWLAHLDSRLRAMLPDLPPPEGNQKALASLQKCLPQPMPPAFREFMLWKPSGLQISFDWEWDDCVTGFVLEPVEMEQFIEEWKQPGPKGTRNWWSSAWIPLLGSGGDFCCIDLSGSLNNPKGSLLSFYHERPARPVSFPNFEGWLRWLGGALEKGMGRAFLGDGRLEFIFNRKVAQLHKEFFPQYPLKASAEILGVGLLDQTLNLLRKQGLEVRCSLPDKITQEKLSHTLLNSFVRDDGNDGESVRVVLLCDGDLTVYANLRPGSDKVEVLSLVAVPESAAQAIRNARSLLEQNQKENAARRLCEAAYGCFQAGLAEEATVLLRRALQLNPENTVATRSLQSLEEKQVKPDPLRLRPLLQHLY